jgi:cyclase
VTRQMLTSDPLHGRTFTSMNAAIPGQIADLKKQLDAASGADRAALQERLRVLEAHLAATAEVQPVAPNVTLSTRMTLHRGGREIQLLFFGRGHTGGDVVVYLPREKVLCSGDLLTAALSYLGDGYVDEWVDSLEALKALPFEKVIPGHGDVFTDRQKIDRFQAYLRDLWKQVAALKAQGLSAQDAARRVDMTAHRPIYPRIEGVGIDPRAVVRLYEVMDARARP